MNIQAWQAVIQSPINEQNLKSELAQIAAHLAFALVELATLKVQHKRAEADLKYTRHLISSLLRADLDRTYKDSSMRRQFGLNEDRIASMVELREEVQTAHDRWLDLDTKHVMASAVVDALVKRKDILVSLAGLSRSELEALHTTT